MTKPLKQAKILIADDEKDMVNALRHRLEFEGYETLAAYEGLRAEVRAYGTKHRFCPSCQTDSPTTIRTRAKGTISIPETMAVLATMLLLKQPIMLLLGNLPRTTRYPPDRQLLLPL